MPTYTPVEKKCSQCNQHKAKKRFCSKKCYWEHMRGLKNEETPRWKPVVGKSRVHQWLVEKYGNPMICESPTCEKKSKWFDWCLITGKNYERDRANFLRMCRSCHRRYDLTPEKRQRAMKNLWWKTGYDPANFKGSPQNLWWYKDTEKMKDYKRKSLS